MNRLTAQEHAEQRLSDYAWVAIGVTAGVILCAQIYSRISWEIYRTSHGRELNHYLIESWKPTVTAWTCDDGSTHFR